MMKSRRHFGMDQKAAILKRYLVDKVPLSDLCDEYGIKPNQVYGWQKILFDHAQTAFQQDGCREARKLSAQEDRIARLEAKLAQKNEVISELMAGGVRRRDLHDDPEVSARRKGCAGRDALRPAKHHRHRRRGAIVLPPANIPSASRSNLTICSGLCRLRRRVIESPPRPLQGPVDSHNTWIRFWGAGQRHL